MIDGEAYLPVPHRPDATMHLLNEINPENLAGLQGVFADIDETISTRGKIHPRAFDALWRLHDAGFRVVPVTGRPAGWCDHIARFWPVDAVVGENGGFYFHHDGSKMRKRFLHGEKERAGFRRRLAALRRRILKEVPGCAVASDQRYREYDLAIDFCEDVPALPRAEVLRIKALFEEAGAHARISSVHVNGWYGDFDKLSTALLCARELFDLDLQADNRLFAFCGDSPNDEPMFRFFERSFGVANVRDFADLMTHKPAFVTTASSGEGFVEMAEFLLKARAMESCTKDPNGKE